MASTTAKVKTLIAVLGSASVYDAERWVETIAGACTELDVFSSLAKHVSKSGSQKKRYDGFVDAIRDDSEQDKNLSLLALASIGRSFFQFNDQGEPYGFRKGTNRVSFRVDSNSRYTRELTQRTQGQCEGTIQDSLTALLPVMLRVHIDEAIKKHNEDMQQKKQDPLGEKPVVLGYLDSYVDDDEFVENFSRSVLSESERASIAEHQVDMLTL